MNDNAELELIPCETCKHCDMRFGSCDLQDFNYCVNVCATWDDMLKHCPLNKQDN